MTSPDLVRALIQLGTTGQPGVPPLLADPERAWDLVMCGDRPWKLVASELDDQDLVLLMKGLVLYSRASGQSGGSVSPVIALYREYMTRGPSDEPDVTAWIVANRVNNYEPFGTIMHGGARTQAEFHAHGAHRARERARGFAADAERQREAARRKGDEATDLLPNAVRRGDLKAVQALVLRGADWRRPLPDGRSLIEFAQEDGRVAVAEYLASLGET